MKTIFIPCRSNADIELVVDNILEKVPFERIGLVTTAQYVHQLKDVQSRLNKAGKKAVIAPGRPNPGQVLGCDAGAAIGAAMGAGPGKGAASKGADCIVYIGSGHFHPLRAALDTGLPTFMVHPSGGIELVSNELLMKHAKIKAARMHYFNLAKRVGILVSTKPGQSRMKQALKLREKLKGVKETFIFAANEIKPEYLEGYDVDAWVSTGCPRIAEDRFSRPVVDISEV